MGLRSAFGRLIEDVSAWELDDLGGELEEITLLLRQLATDEAAVEGHHVANRNLCCQTRVDVFVG